MAALRTTIAGQPFGAEATGSFDFAKQLGEGSYSVAGEPGSTPFIQDHQVFYEKVPGQDRWLRWDPSSQTGTPVVGPGELLNYLKGLSSDMQEVGTAELRGVGVRHVRATVDPAKLVGATSSNSVTKLATGSTAPIPTEIYVDDDGRVRKLEMRIVTNLGALTDDPRVREIIGNRSTESTITAEYFDFGVPVNVRVPDPSSVQRGGTLPGPR